MDTCQVKYCRKPSILVYAIFPSGPHLEVCELHWACHCDDEDTFTLTDPRIRKENTA